METIDANCALARSAGYDVLGTHVLPHESWVNGYYEMLEPKSRALLVHQNDDVRQTAAAMLQEIDIFRVSQGSYGYVFYVLQSCLASI